MSQWGIIQSRFIRTSTLLCYVWFNAVKNRFIPVPPQSGGYCYSAPDCNTRQHGKEEELRHEEAWITHFHSILP